MYGKSFMATITIHAKMYSQSLLGIQVQPGGAFSYLFAYPRGSPCTETSEDDFSGSSDLGQASKLLAWDSYSAANRGKHQAYMRERTRRAR